MNKVLRVQFLKEATWKFGILFGPKRDEVTREWRNVGLNDLYSLPNILRVVKSRK
jgi:hypothetical protein